jgi:hypothetical protein
MLSVSWLAAAGLVMGTAGYVEQPGDATSRGYGSNHGSLPPRSTHYQLAQNSDRDRDRNRDGIPDRYQQRSQQEQPRSLLNPSSPQDPPRSLLNPSYNPQDPPRSLLR